MPTAEAKEPALTEFEIPLTDENLKELGRFTATFSQIDFLLSEVITTVTGTPWWALQLMLETATTGPKMNILRKALPEIKDRKARALAKDACDKLAQIIDKRNHIVHGMWIRQLVTPQKVVKRACYFQKYKNDPIFASDLRKYSDKGAKITRILGDVLTQIAKGAAWEKPRTMYVTDRDTSELAWFLGDAALKKRGYPNPGDTLIANPPPPQSSPK